MNKNKIKLGFLALWMALPLIHSCSSDFLEAKPRGTDYVDNYYRNEAEAFNGLIAIYDVLGWQGGNYVSKMSAMNAASDDMFAGGGGANDVTDLQVISNYTVAPEVGPQGELWRGGYSGVSRANILLERLPDVPMNETTKTRFAAEAKFLRAYFYFDLVRLFENIPLILESLTVDNMYNVPQVEPAAVYAQIEKDLQEAIPDLPATVPDNEKGRITQGAGHALLGKCFLQLERFNEAAAEFALVNGTPGSTSTYGYRLLDNFEDLWVVSNKHNSESILEINRTNISGGSWGCISCTEGNLINQMSAPRSYVATDPSAPDYIGGWGFFIVTPTLREFMHNDGRYKATISDVDSLVQAGVATYTTSYQNTGFFLEKYMGRLSDRYDGAGNSELNFPQNQYEIRLADVYLLEAEALVRGGGDLGRAQALYNAVRNRAGMGSKPVSFDNILEERRLELAGEGHRWFDLVRTGRAAEALAFKGFQAGRNEVLPIPLLEFENTILEQNREYGGTK